MDYRKLSYIFGLFGVAILVTLIVVLALAYFLGWPFEEDAPLEVPSYPVEKPIEYPEFGKG